ncbi:MAG TPA: RHS repeat-associated core domain-containing protein, partial [Thermoanaerobaculia bacterium]|nr:RHS repeat-associated core domain-containing protein [Thermoanaerobaculia bacterium]
RLTTANTTATLQPNETFAYDDYGNMTTHTIGSNPTTMSVVTATNRFTTGGTTPYQRDAVGNLTADAEATYAYDPFSMLRASVSQTASGPTTYHYHLDHLGTPRLITGNGGSLVAKHAYYPFGSEMALTPTEASAELMKFTGHERDVVAGDNHSVDYMHARFYNANLGRFLAMDPDLYIEKTLPEPQRWNRYAYVVNNPMHAIDPTGRDTYLVNRYINTSILTNRGNFISHTFIMTTSGGHIHTYSWGNAGNKNTVGRLFKHTPEDLTAAAKAYGTSELLRLVYASREGDASLDPYIDKVFQEHANRANDRSNHANYGVCRNCKTEASEIIDEAKRRKADDEKKKPDPKNATVKSSPADHQAQTPANH